MKRRYLTRMFIFSLLLLAACSGGSIEMGRATIPSSTPTATMAPAPGRVSPVDPSAAIEAIIQKMSLDEKIGQLLMIEHTAASYDSDIDTYVKDLHIGGLIIYTYDHGSANDLHNLTSKAQTNSTLPLMIATDQEGGWVDRLQFFYPPSPSAQALSNTNDPAKAQADGALQAQRLRALGINADLAPVADVGDSSAAYEGPRLWSDSPTQTIKMAGAFLRGLQGGGVPGCLKHWPGIGAITPVQNPHVTLPTLSTSLDQLNAVDFAPFKGLLAYGPAMIMTTHVILPAIDPVNPTSLSPALVDGTLRGKLGYQGVIITDQLHMEAIIQHYGLNEAAVLAILAGNDIIEGATYPGNALDMRNAIRAAVNSGRIPSARIDVSVRRILRLKFAYGMGTDKLYAYAGIRPPSQG